MLITKRQETDVLTYYAQNMPPAEIAMRVKLSISTVYRLLREAKLPANRVQLSSAVIYRIKKRLINGESPESIAQFFNLQPRLLDPYVIEQKICKLATEERTIKEIQLMLDIPYHQVITTLHRNGYRQKRIWIKHNTRREGHEE